MRCTLREEKFIFHLNSELEMEAVINTAKKEDWNNWKESLTQFNSKHASKLSYYMYCTFRGL